MKGIKNLILLALVLGMVVINPVILARLIKGPGGSFSLVVALVLWILSLGFMLSFIYLLVNKDQQRMIRLIVLSLISGVFVLEIFLQLVGLVFLREDPFDKFKRYQTEALKNQPNAKEILQEYNSIERDLKPYVGYMMRPFKGKYVNILPEGIRVTHNPITSEQADYQLYFFGGSTGLGDGSRDSATIPSVLSQELNKQGIRVFVTNYANAGTTFTTELIRLIVLLKEGRRPDMVVFYDGVNDGAAATSGKPGEISSYEAVFHPEMENFHGKMVKSGIVGLMQQHIKLFTLISSIKSMLLQRETALNIEQAEDYADRYIKYYQQGIDLLEKLAGAYKFKYVLLWQPNAFLEKQLLPGEEKALMRWPRNVQHIAVHQVIQRRWADHKINNFVDISDALAYRQEPLYHDWCHLSEKGDAMIGKKIAQVVKPYFGAR